MDLNATEFKMSTATAVDSTPTNFQESSVYRMLMYEEYQTILFTIMRLLKYSSFSNHITCMKPDFLHIPPPKQNIAKD